MTGFMCTNGKWNCRTAPLSPSRTGSVPAVIAEEAYKEYAAQFGTSQSLQRLNERGGFGDTELAIMLYERIKRIEAKMPKTKDGEPVCLGQNLLAPSPGGTFHWAGFIVIEIDGDRGNCFTGQVRTEDGIEFSVDVDQCFSSWEAAEKAGRVGYKTISEPSI
jgi:hypothetical protein